MLSKKEKQQAYLKIIFRVDMHFWNNGNGYSLFQKVPPLNTEYPQKIEKYFSSLNTVQKGIDKLRLLKKETHSSLVVHSDLDLLEYFWEHLIGSAGGIQNLQEFWKKDLVFVESAPVRHIEEMEIPTFPGLPNSKQESTKEHVLIFKVCFGFKREFFTNNLEGLLGVTQDGRPYLLNSFLDRVFFSPSTYGANYKFQYGFNPRHYIGYRLVDYPWDNDWFDVNIKLR